MGQRFRAVAVVSVVLVVGAFIGSALSQWITFPPSGAVEAPVGIGAAPDERVRVQVLNGAGVPGLARDATEYLREVGFDVVDFRNAEAFDHDASVVLDRVGALDWAEAVAGAMRIGAVRTEADSNLFVDVTVVLGRDWVRPVGDGSSPGLGTRPAWWDLRRFFREENREPGAPSGGPDDRLVDPAEIRNRDE